MRQEWSITLTITINISMIFLLFGFPNSFEQQDPFRNWIIGESDKLNFKYPSHWDVKISDSRFDDYELIFRDKAGNSSIRVSDEAISTTNKILHGNNPERYFDVYMMQNLSLSSDASKIETYPKGKVSIAGLPAYSELYLDQENAILISLAFQKENDRHYTVIAKSISSTYDSLEPTMLEIIKSITPKTIQKPSNVQLKIGSNITDIGHPIKNQSTEQQKKDSLIKTGSLLSNTTKNNNLNKSLIIKQQQENRSLTQSSNIYEGLGIKFKYFDPWKMGLLQADEPTCLNFCNTQLSLPDNEAMILIVQEKLNSPKIKNNCKCDTLLEFVKYEYENTISKYEDLVFINDNQTTLTYDKIPAIQMEYEKKGFTLSDENLIDKSFDIFTKSPYSFYRIVFSADNNKQYLNYLKDFKKMINSLEFVSYNETKSKQPSFMSNNNQEQEQEKQKISQTTITNNSSDIGKKTTNETLLVQNNTNKESLDTTSTLDQKQQDQQPKENTTLTDVLPESNTIKILSNDSYIDSMGDMHVIGEVKNNTPKVAQFVEIIGTFYDNNNKVVGTSSTFTTPTDLAPGAIAPFDLILYESSISQEKIERYTLTISQQ